MSNWSRLYSLADRINALKPWRYMYEDEIIGVRDPVSGVIGFVSVMGNLGEHHAITVYLGERALGQYLELSNHAAAATPEMVLEIPQLMLSFEEKEFLEKEDRTILKSNGISYTGKKLRPLFRSYRPGMVPWFFEESEQESMINYLEQFLEVAISADSSEGKSKPGSIRQEVSLVREYTNTGGQGIWKDTYQQILIPSLEELSIPINTGMLAKAKNIPVGTNIWEIDFFLTPAQMKEKNQRPYFPYMLLVVDKKSEFVISHELMNPTDGIDKMLSQIPGLLLKIFSNGKSLPVAVYTPSHRLADLIFPILNDLGIKYQVKPRLKSLEMAKIAIFEFLSRG